MKTEEKNNPYEKQVLVIKSSIQKMINSKGYHMNELTPRAVNDAVIEILDKAIIRTKLGKRKTVFPKDV